MASKKVKQKKGITRRPINDDDLEFLFRVYAATRTDIASLPWSDEQKTELYNHQFQAQHVHYQKFFAGAQFEVVMLDGKRVGRLYINRNEHEFRVIDISLLPEFRGRGIGRMLIGEIIAEAKQKGKPVRLRVQPNSPMRSWYERLGFEKIADEQTNWHMEKQP